jgi:hypothetical protein
MDRRRGRDDVQLLTGAPALPAVADAELVAFGIGHHDPPVAVLLDGLADEAMRAEAATIARMRPTWAWQARTIGITERSVAKAGNCEELRPGGGVVAQQSV